jgi:hypothetical protein
MGKMQFKIDIQAPKEKVWETLWNDSTYQEWTSAFAEGSRAETDWEEGSKVLFTDGKGSGMVSVIAEKKPNEFMSFKHLGTVVDGVEDLDSEKNKPWAGALENYTLKGADGKTELLVDMDFSGLSPEMTSYFEQAWPKALDKLKEVAEKN